MKSNIVRLASYLFFVLIVVCSCHSHCDEVERVREFRIEGIIEKKYRRELNHNSYEIEFTNNANNDHVKYLIGDNVNSIYLESESSGFWQYVQVGDSITKYQGRLEIWVYRNGAGKRKFELLYGCK